MEYLTIKKDSKYEFTIKRSKFIGHIKPVSTESEALEFIEKIKSKHYDAKHNVFAYALKSEKITRFSDDSEPSGTAGKMALEAITKNNLFDVVIVVTRYFGGILLGTGGLSRAYFKAAKEAINLAGIAKIMLCTQAEITCDYKVYDKILNLALKFGAIVGEKNFSDKINFIICMPNKNLESFKKQFLNLFYSNAEMKIIGESYEKIS